MAASAKPTSSTPRTSRAPGPSRSQASLPIGAPERSLPSSFGDDPLTRGGVGKLSNAADQPRPRRAQVLRSSPAPKCSARSFHKRKYSSICQRSSCQLFRPLLETIEELTERTREYESKLEETATEAALFGDGTLEAGGAGVGTLTSLTFS
jgi:hypothetical protein